MIRTTQRRRLYSPALRQSIEVEKIFDDEEATFDTWDVNAMAVAAEYNDYTGSYDGVPLDEAHRMLHRTFPQWYEERPL